MANRNGRYSSIPRLSVFLRRPLDALAQLTTSRETLVDPVVGPAPQLSNTPPRSRRAPTSASVHENAMNLHVAPDAAVAQRAVSSSHQPPPLRTSFIPIRPSYVPAVGAHARALPAPATTLPSRDAALGQGLRHRRPLPPSRARHQSRRLDDTRTSSQSAAPSLAHAPVPPPAPTPTPALGRSRAPTAAPALPTHSVAGPLPSAKRRQSVTLEQPPNAKRRTETWRADGPTIAPPGPYAPNSAPALPPAPTAAVLPVAPVARAVVPAPAPPPALLPAPTVLPAVAPTSAPPTAIVPAATVVSPVAPAPAPSAALLLPSKRRQSVSLDPPPAAKRSRTTSSGDHALVVAAPAPVQSAPGGVPPLRPARTEAARPRPIELPGGVSVKERRGLWESRALGGGQRSQAPAPAPTQVTQGTSVRRSGSSGSSRETVAGTASTPAAGAHTASLPVDVAPLPASKPAPVAHSLPAAPPALSDVADGPAPAANVAPPAPVAAPPPPSTRARPPPSALPPPPTRIPGPAQPAPAARTTTRARIPSSSTAQRENVPLPGPTGLARPESQTQRARPGEAVGSRLPLASRPTSRASDRGVGGGGVRDAVSRASSNAALQQVAKAQNISKTMISDWTAALRVLADVKGDVVDGEVKRDCDKTFEQMEAHINVIKREGLRSERLKDIRLFLRAVGRKEAKAGSAMSDYAVRATALIENARTQML